ncbi:MAG: hypothetical protein LBF97_04595 [Elusimicrobiota bacterium]|jgi:hypothetical protein|nr:hypothetical protein [Elusimicrobiota bacterium]
MKLKCENSYYKFYPYSTHELNLFEYSVSKLVLKKDYFTFPFLADLEGFSIKNFQYANLVSTKTYSGRVEKVLLENKFVYDISNNQLATLESMTKILECWQMDYLAFKTFPQCGYLIKNKQLKSFSGYFDIQGSGIITLEKVEFY